MVYVKDLAKLAIEVLDAQQRYFKSRTKEDLIAAHAVESRYAWALKAYGDRANWLHNSEGKPSEK